jgi:nucleoside diphosphate kinase
MVPIDLGTGRLGDEIPPWLSVQPMKRRFYGLDLYFREGWEDLTAVGSAEEVRSWLECHTLLLCKPDAVAGRELEAVFSWLARQGATVVAAEVVAGDRHVIRALWEFQWNIATRDRRDVTELFMALAPMLLLVVRMPEDALPAAVRVADLKGSANVSDRAPHQLRSSLTTVNYILNGVHSPDEPADVVRELSVLLDEQQRRRIVQAIRTGTEESPNAKAQQLYAETPVVSALGLGSRRTRWLDAIDSAARNGPIGTDRGAALQAVLAEVESGKRGWREFAAAMEGDCIPWDPWDTVVLGTTFAEAHLPDRFRILPGTSPAEWARD